MSEPPRITSDPDATELERELVDSWSQEQPSRAAKTRALGIAGMTAAAVATGVTATSAAAATAATAAAAGSTGAAAAGTGAGALAPKVAASALLKWLFVGGLVAAGGVATYAAVESRRAPGEPAPSAAAPVSRTTTAPAVETAAPPSSPPPTAEPPTLSPADLPSIEPAAPRAVIAPAPAPSASSLAAEIALFDRAHAALDSGDHRLALTLVDEYEARYRNGAFAQEAEVLRMQALLRAGDRVAAKKVGQRFLSAHPTSPHATRIRAMLEASER